MAQYNNRSQCSNHARMESGKTNVIFVCIQAQIKTDTHTNVACTDKACGPQLSDVKNNFQRTKNASIGLTSVSK